MKSAWERALEKLDDAGIERPDPSSLTPGQRDRLEEIRTKAEARLAELQILHRDRIAAANPSEREQLERELAVERERVASRRDRDIARLRAE